MPPPLWLAASTGLAARDAGWERPSAKGIQKPSGDVISGGEAFITVGKAEIRYFDDYLGVHISSNRRFGGH